MEGLREFLSALASHWLLLGLAILALLYCQFGNFDPEKKAMPMLVLFALVCFLYALYLTISQPLAVINRPL